MARQSPPIAAALLAALGLGAIAVAIVATAVGLSTSSAQRIGEAARQSAAVDLLEQRHTVAGLYAAEQAATVRDAIDLADNTVAAPFTAQREQATKEATTLFSAVADRGDSVGNEAQRWIVAHEATTPPTVIDATFERLVAFDRVIDTACCAGIVGSDAHHSEDLDKLEEVGAAMSSPWDIFYVAVGADPTSLPSSIEHFLGQRGITGQLPAGTKPPSRALAATETALLTDLGISQETVNATLNSEPMATLDQIVLIASGETGNAIAADDAFVAANAAYQSLHELFVAAVDTTRTELNGDVAAAEQTRLLANVITPILLLILLGIGYVVYRAARSRERALRHEGRLLDARNRFMRMVSHELRTPATAISGFSHMLSTEWTSLTDTEINEFLRIIDQQSTHLSFIVDDLLTLSHLETGRLRLHLGTVHLASVAAEAVAMVDHRYEIDVATTIDPGLVLLADRDRLVQILRNLVENAAKYGKVDVGISAAALGDSCDIVVSDSGSDIPRDEAEEIFRFWNRGFREADQVRGHGMGLAIARHLARAMVGDLRYRPRQPMGSEFILTLPLTTAEAGQRGARTETPTAKVS